MKRKVGLWNPVILIPAGVIVILVGLIIYLQSLRREKRFTGKAEAAVKSVSRGSHHSNGVTRHVYTPKVVYTVDGNTYEVSGQGSGKSDYYVEGTNIVVYYDPNKPEKCVTMPFNDTRRGAGITMLIGAVIALLGVVSIFLK